MESIKEVEKQLNITLDSEEREQVNKWIKKGFTVKTIVNGIKTIRKHYV